MTCSNARALLTAYVDSELDVANSIEIETHLESCPACARIVDSQQRVRSAIQSGSLAYQLPGGLRERTGSALRQESAALEVEAEGAGIASLAAGGEPGAQRQRTSSPPAGEFNVPPGRPPRRTAWPWIAVAAGVLLAIFLTGKIAFGPSGPPADLVAQEIVDSHIRAAMPGHLTDVESTDRHTVKPWFNGKLDFSPPVEDFTSDGFPLTGGRLDAIGGKTVAALIYRRNRHLINLYVWPSTEPASTPALREIQGYNLVHWNQAGFAWWLVSDLNASELQQLASRLRGSVH
jgi:anti-sigma factor RsiW